jgi:hypothetical protein
MEPAPFIILAALTNDRGPCKTSNSVSPAIFRSVYIKNYKKDRFYPILLMCQCPLEARPLSA